MKLSKSESAFVLRWAKRLTIIRSLGGCCKNCGCKDEIVLDFHHDSGGKEGNLSSWLRDGRRLSEIKNEAKKCSLLCSNCHIEHHCNNSRGSSIKSSLMDSLEKCSCMNCGHTSETGASICFHHREGEVKLFNLGDVTGRKKVVSVMECLEEMSKCDILCRNCHARVHTDVDKINRLRIEIEKRVKSHVELRPEVDRVLISKMRREGLGVTGIAKELGCAKSTISLALKKM